MFIKKIIISGFRSYAETNELSDLSSGHNVIVGGNGCGKSNVLNAIQFVLSDEYNGLNANQRQQLMSERQSQRLLTAFVEVVVDNSDRRMPLDCNEISFRRQIGLKKDQYFMNNKISSHSEIVNLLEAAGFSRLNPYYIIKQGKVNEMSTASDEYRLQVMREVAGTRVYDQKKTEAMTLLAKTQENCKDIDHCLKALDQRLENLVIESKDLEKYLKWDKRKRLLDYIITNRESEAIKTQMLSLEDRQQVENEVLDNKRVKLQEIQQKKRQIDKRVKTLCGVVGEYRQEVTELNSAIDEENERKAKIESKINDFRDKLNDNNDNQIKIGEELKQLKQSIEKKKKRMVFVNAKYEELKNDENRVIRELSEKKSRKVELYSKQKRKEKFGTVEERNRWIEEELVTIRKEIETNEKRISVLKSEEFEINEKKVQLQNELKNFDSEEEHLISSLQNEKKEICDTNKRLQTLRSKRLLLLDSENQLKEKELKLSEEKVKLFSKLKKISGTSATVGRESVHKVLDSFKQRSDAKTRPIIEGYLGQVIDCFVFDANISKAIEVTAKNKLFHHMIETDKIATKILSEVNDKKMFGEMTFIAINKLKDNSTKYPDFGDNARPLSSLIKFDQKYAKVMKFLFDRTLVCRNIEMASKFSRSSKMDCVTVDGDFVSHTGVMSGGYFGPETRMETFFKWKNTVNEIESNQLKLSQNSDQREANETELNEMFSLLSNIDIKHNKTGRKLENIRISRERIRHQLSDLNVKYESIDRSIASLESTLCSMKANRDSFESELGLSLDSQLNESEQKELNQILNSIESLSKDHSVFCRRRNKFGSELAAIESDLDKNLEQRKNELEFTLIDYEIYKNETHLEKEWFECQHIDDRIESLKRQIEDMNTKIDDLIKQHIDQKELLENLRLAEDKQMDIIALESKNSRKISIKLESLSKKSAECVRKLRKLGTIPSDCDTNYQSLSLSQQYRELQKCSLKISRVSFVNQKALDQLLDGQKKQKLLNTEKRALDLGYKSIQELIETLEHQKYEKIQLTYKSVSKYFCEIFKQFVPEGKAFIDMIYSYKGVNSIASTSTQSSQESQSSGGISDEAQTSASHRIDNFVGVRIRVSFTGKSVTKEINQLSGGQKSIVALAFIFAIQRCDSPPFYLFDEVDQALDPIYRKALTDIIKEMSKTSQFITTTFRPELLESAHKLFGVKFRNGISHIEEIDAQMAKEFIEVDDSRDHEKSRSRKSVRFDITDNGTDDGMDS